MIRSVLRICVTSCTCLLDNYFNRVDPLIPCNISYPSTFFIFSLAVQAKRILLVASTKMIMVCNISKIHFSLDQGMFIFNSITARGCIYVQQCIALTISEIQWCISHFYVMHMFQFSPLKYFRNIMQCISEIVKAIQFKVLTN